MHGYVLVYYNMPITLEMAIESECEPIWSKDGKRDVHILESCLR